MNSLEIVNEIIEDLKSRLESANYLANGNPSEFGKQVISDFEKKLKKLETIKQDLVVLAILKKRNVNLSKLLYLFMKLEKGKIKNIDEIHREYNIFQNEKGYLTMGEILKLKQWLEENE